MTSIMLAQLRTFIAVAEKLNFSAAARQLNLPRATISARIQELEKQLGVRLLHRSNKHVSLTNEGSHYLQACIAAINVLDDAQSQLAPAKKPSGIVRVGLPKDLPQDQFLADLQGFQLSYPEISIELAMSDSIVDLIDHRIDMAIRGKDPRSPDLIARALQSVKVVLAAHPEFVQHKVNKNISHCAIHDPLSLSPVKFKKPTLIANDLQATINLCLLAKGAAILPQPICQPYVDANKLVLIPSAIALPQLDLYLVYANRNLMPARVKVLRDFLLANLRASD